MHFSHLASCKLRDAKHSVDKQDRPKLLNLLRKVVYAETKTDLQVCLEELNLTCLKYQQYQRHLTEDTFPYRVTNSLPTSDNNTNNPVETSFRYTKEEQFNRHKAYNLPDMLSLLLDNSEFYANKCVDAANNRLESWLKNCHSKYIMKTPNIDPEKIVEIGPHSFLVPSETHSDVSYLMDLGLRMCTCPHGRLKGPCKHKQLVSDVKGLPCFDVIPSKNPEMRKVLMYLGTGKNLSLDWFLPLQAEATADESEVGDPVPDSVNIINSEGAAPTTSEANPVEVIINERSTNPSDVKAKLIDSLSQLQAKLVARLDGDVAGYDKAVETFAKTVNKLPSTSDSSLQKALHTFGKSVTQVIFT